MLVCFFGSFRPTQECFTHIYIRHHTRRRTAKFELFSALIAIEQWAYHTYCDTGYPFIMVISEVPWNSHLLPSVWQWSFHYLFLRLGSVAAGIPTPNFPLAKALLDCATAASQYLWKSLWTKCVKHKCSW